MLIENKVALITGAAGGIGRAFCKALLDRGAKVSLVDFDPIKGSELLSEFNSKYGKDRAIFIQCNVTKPLELESAFNETFSKWGSLDIVCNNAGVGERKIDWQSVIDINLTAVIHGTNLAISKMLRNEKGKGGIIVNTASMGGLVPMPFAPVYSASKFGVVGYTRSLGHYAKQNIRINAICPSFTETALVSEGIQQSKIMAKTIDSLGPLLTPDLVAQGLIQLIEDDSKAGEIMRVTNNNGIDYQTYGGYSRRDKADSAPKSKL